MRDAKAAARRVIMPKYCPSRPIVSASLAVASWRGLTLTLEGTRAGGTDFAFRMILPQMKML